MLPASGLFHLRSPLKIAKEKPVITERVDSGERYRFAFLSESMNYWTTKSRTQSFMSPASAGTITVIAETVECIVSVDHLSWEVLLQRTNSPQQEFMQLYTVSCVIWWGRTDKSGLAASSPCTCCTHYIIMRPTGRARRFLQFMMPQNENAIPTHCSITHSTLNLFGALHECDHVAACQKL